MQKARKKTNGLRLSYRAKMRFKKDDDSMIVSVGNEEYKECRDKGIQTRLESLREINPNISSNYYYQKDLLDIVNKKLKGFTTLNSKLAEEVFDLAVSGLEKIGGHNFVNSNIHPNPISGHKTKVKPFLENYVDKLLTMPSINAKLIKEIKNISDKELRSLTTNDANIIKLVNRELKGRRLKKSNNNNTSARRKSSNIKPVNSELRSRRSKKQNNGGTSTRRKSPNYARIK